MIVLKILQRLKAYYLPKGLRKHNLPINYYYLKNDHISNISTSYKEVQRFKVYSNLKTPMTEANQELHS